MTTLDDAELERIADKTCKKYYQNYLQTKSVESALKPAVLEALKQIRDARLKWPSDERCESALSLLTLDMDRGTRTYKTTVLTFNSAIKWLRSQLRLEPYV